MIWISKEFGQLALNKANIKGDAIDARFISDNGCPFIRVAYYGEKPVGLSGFDYYRDDEDEDNEGMLVVYLTIDCHIYSK